MTSRILPPERVEHISGRMMTTNAALSTKQIRGVVLYQVAP